MLIDLLDDQPGDVHVLAVFDPPRDARADGPDAWPTPFGVMVPARQASDPWQPAVPWADDDERWPRLVAALRVALDMGHGVAVWDCIAAMEIGLGMEGLGAAELREAGRRLGGVQVVGNSACLCARAVPC